MTITRDDRTRGSLTDQVVDLLIDQVPSEVLATILDQLTRGAEDEDVELRQLLQRGFLSGALQRTWGPAVSAFALVGVRSPEPDQLLAQVELHAHAYRQRFLRCQVDGTLWLLLPAAAHTWLKQALTETHLPGCLALRQDLSDLAQAPAHRVTMDRLLDAGQRRGWTGFPDGQQLAVPMRVDALLDLAARQPEWHGSALDVLLDDPAQQILVMTLLTWFREGGHIGRMAAVMHLHPNTVRYRLRRALELTGLDLSDWDQRLLAELQLRLWVREP